MKKTQSACLFITFILCACGPKVPEPQANSVTYYLEHPAEMTAQGKECQKRENGEISAMPTSKQQEWLASVEGINCGNVQLALMRAHQRRYIDSDAELGRMQERQKQQQEKQNKK